MNNPDKELCPRDKWIEEQRQHLKKVQCSVCFHWVYSYHTDNICEGCYEEEDEEPYLWADWRQRCTL